jgi:hypothetical protein
MALSVFLLWVVMPRAAWAQTVIEARTYHLGVAGEPEWEEYAAQPPDARRLDLRFEAQANPREASLLIRQRDVKQVWEVRLNDRKIGELMTMETALVRAMAVPTGALRDGENTLSIVPPGTVDDIFVGEIRLDRRPLAEALASAKLDVRVTDTDSGLRLPCRITVVDEQGSLAPLWVSSDQKLAARPGVVYSRDGRAQIGVPAGPYRIHATRGFEYGLDTREVSVAEGETQPVALSIRREVPTAGLASSDTHIHTVTLSGHGDATTDERMLTLAGEGVELPIATDHNVYADYRPAADRMGVQAYFTPVVGDEVTTSRGHFNAFPFDPAGPVPDFHLTDWTKLMQAIRSAPGERVIVLNHPRDLHSNFRPFDPENFNAVSGENKRGFEFGFDAVEVVNSSAMQSDLMQPFRDWFALLNHGYRVTAVGSSDCHDVSRYIVGQGRTYVACRDDDAARIDVAEAVRSYRAGRALVSLGLLATLTVDDRFHVGDLATGLGSSMRMVATVLGPSWTSADHVALYADGVKIREQAIAPNGPAVAGQKAKVEWTLPKPAHDVHLVVIASGPGVSAPYWPIARPYQPTSRAWQLRVLGATNPVWIDADDNGSYTSPRALATAVLEHTGTEPTRLIAALATYDEAVAAQAASLCQAHGVDVRANAFQSSLVQAAEPVRRGFAAYAASLSKTPK